jgi:hypothetical protein
LEESVAKRAQEYADMKPAKEDTGETKEEKVMDEVESEVIESDDEDDKGGSDDEDKDADDK